MWFKNLSLFRFTEPFAISAEELAEKLEKLRFQPCAPHAEFSIGWTEPLESQAQSLVHASNGFLLVSIKKETRVLPASVINEMLQDKITEAEAEFGKKVSKKERTRLKDDLIFELLPKSFTYSKKMYAYIDPIGGWLAIDSAPAKNAEDLLSILRKATGSLPATRVNTMNSPTMTMTQWLMNQQPPDDFQVQDECELLTPGEEGGIIRCKRHDLALPEIQNHLDSGKEVVKLAVTWADRLSFILDKDLAIKRLRFLDLVQDQLKDMDIEDEATRFDADFALMTAELAQFLPRLLAVFGGERIQQ